MYCTNCGKEIQEMANICPYCDTATQNYKATPYAHPNARSKIAAGLFGIFLGTWGIHNFYLKNNAKAITQLLLGTIGFVIVVGPIISSIWGLIEGILILAGEIREDGEGIPLTN